MDIDNKKLYGVFYTPDNLALVLSRWALAQGTGPILDPSFGGCAFLNAAAQVIGGKDNNQPVNKVFGVDIDATCVKYVRQNDKLIEKNCIIGDFLEFSPNKLPGAPYAAIVGNPPFVKHHWLTGSTRLAARTAVVDSGIRLPATASTWAYFLVHSFGFLARSGRLAMLVPEAILQANYAGPVREALRGRFKDVRLIHVRDRLFEGTNEPIVVVAASGYGSSGKLSIDSIERVEDLERLLLGSKSKGRASREVYNNGRQISQKTLKILNELRQDKSVYKMRDLASVRIGFVTGANGHFILNARDIKRLRIPAKARLPVVARTQWLSGLAFTTQDHNDLAIAGRKAYLVRPTPAYDQNTSIQQWIREGIQSGANKRYKCNIRTDWFRVQLPAVPDAFATCTRLRSPLLIINQTPYRCSNTIHSVKWSKDLPFSPNVVAIGFLTSAVSVWAELNGRRYGGGVLKMEPGTLKQASVPLIPSVEDAFDEIDSLLRGGQEEKARKLADKLVLVDGLGMPEKDIRRLQEDRIQLMNQRYPARNGAGRG